MTPKEQYDALMRRRDEIRDAARKSITEIEKEALAQGYLGPIQVQAFHGG